MQAAAGHGTDPRWMCRGKASRQDTAKAAPRPGCSRENSPKVGGKAFLSRAAKPRAGEAAPPAISPVPPPGAPPAPPHRSPKPYCTWKAQRNEKVKQRQMQSTDKKYQGVNRLCFFMPKIFAFLFLPWRHKPLLLSHNHLHCRCQEELQLGEGDPFSRRSLCNGVWALRGQTRWSPFIRTRERHNPSEEGVSHGMGQYGAPQGHTGRSPYGPAPAF